MAALTAVGLKHPAVPASAFQAAFTDEHQFDRLTLIFSRSSVGHVLLMQHAGVMSPLTSEGP